MKKIYLRILAIFLIFILTFTSISKPLYAMPIVLAPYTIAAIGSVLVASGMYFSSKEALEQTATYAYYSNINLWDSILSSTVSNPYSPSVAISSSLWGQITSWVSSKFGTSNDNITVDVITGAASYTGVNLHNIRFSDTRKNDLIWLDSYNYKYIWVSVIEVGGNKGKRSYRVVGSMSPVYFVERLYNNRTLLNAFVSSGIMQASGFVFVSGSVWPTTTVSDIAQYDSTDGLYQLGYEEVGSVSTEYFGALPDNLMEDGVFFPDVTNVSYDYSISSHDTVLDNVGGHVESDDDIISIPIPGVGGLGSIDDLVGKQATEVPIYVGDTLVQGTVIPDIGEGTETGTGTGSEAEVETGTGTIDLAPTNSLLKDIQSAITDIGAFVSSIPDNFIGDNELNFDGLKASGTAFSTKFPFSIPFDLISLVSSLQATPEAPRFVVSFSGTPLSLAEDIIIDFSKFDTLAQIIRYFILLLFMFGLIVQTRKLIKG